MSRVFDTLPTFFETERNVVAFDDILYKQCMISYDASDNTISHKVRYFTTLGHKDITIILEANFHKVLARLLP